MTQEAAMRHALTDDQWKQLEPFFPKTKPGRGRPWHDHRRIVHGILWWIKTGVPWRDLPEYFGKWTTVYNRFRRWVKEGFWDKLLWEIQKLKDQQGGIDRTQWNVDGTSVRAHVSAAGSRSQAPGEPENHGLGYSRGGYTSKLHLVVDNLTNVLNVTLTEGQSHETKEFEHLLTSTPLTWGKTRRWPKAVAGDKGYSSRKNREFLRRRRIESVIARKTKEPREENFDKQKYRRRNVVERVIGWLKINRRVATRYEKNALHYLAVVKIAILWKSIT